MVEAGEVLVLPAAAGAVDAGPVVLLVVLLPPHADTVRRVPARTAVSSKARLGRDRIRNLLSSHVLSTGQGATSRSRSYEMRAAAATWRMSSNGGRGGFEPTRPLTRPNGFKGSLAWTGSLVQAESGRLWYSE